jgi:uncharacterized protein (TIGR02145 family)
LINTKNKIYMNMKNFSAPISPLKNQKLMKYFYLATFALLCILTTQLNAQTTYLWSTGATTPTISVNPTVTTTYYVTITHNGVEYLDSMTIVVNQPNSSEENVTAPASFTWNANGQTYTASGTYTATFQNAAGCDSTVTLNLTISEPLQYDLTQSATLVCEGEEVILSVSLPSGGAPASWPSGYVHCNPSNPTQVVEVTNPVTGATWMDRNLGANRAATSSTDAEAYGSLFQWGRGADGHQCVNRYAGDGVTTSNTTATLSSTDTPGHGDFITINGSPYDWRSPQNNNLWQGVNGTNNPCPSGYRLPTDTELNAERLSWSSNNSAGAFASPLKLPLAGGSNGSLYNVGAYGNYWSSTVSSTYSRYLLFGGGFFSTYATGRASGHSVRCIKN